MKRLTKKQVLEQTDGGLRLFQILLPKLEMLNGRNRVNIDSPISKGQNCFSVFARSPMLYYFKDHFTGNYGDIFEFVARLNNLNSKHDFKKVLDIIGDILEGCYHQIPIDQIDEYFNPVDNTVLKIVKEGYSEMFVECHFKNAMPYLNDEIKYAVHLVRSFRAFNSVGHVVNYEFDYSKPQEAFYALRITKGEFYVLFNPSSRKSYQWGKSPEFYVIGMEKIFQIGYCENILLRNTLVLTNSVEGLLFLQDNGIPSIAVLNGETELPSFFEEVISPMFPKKYLLFDLNPKIQEQIKSFTRCNEYEYIRIKESYLGLFFSRNKDAIDDIMRHFEFCEDFIYEGRASEIIKV